LINIAICERCLTDGSHGEESSLRGRRNMLDKGQPREKSPIHDCDLCNLASPEKAAADDSVNRRRSVAGPRFQEWKAIVSGEMWLAATATLAGAAVAVIARTGPATSEPTVPSVRMAGARMLRRMRMTTSMR